MAVEIETLGPIGVRSETRGEGEGSPGPAQRRLLAVLAAEAGRVVSSERLAEELGLASVSGVRTAVSRLRQLVGEVVRREPPGYVLAADAVDAHRFLRLVTEARSSDGLRAIELYDEALALHRGPAFMEFAHEEWAEAEAARLDELCATAREERIAALLAANRMEDAVSEADRMARDHPFRERPRAQLMTALARQGRATEALRIYQEFRAHLVDEIGVEPSAELAKLEHRILAGEIMPRSRSYGEPLASHAERGEARTMTFLFTDIEGSTARWEADSQAMRADLERHDGVLRSAVESHGGQIFKHTGDGMCAVFESAPAAIAAAIDAQANLQLPVRMGVGTGEVQARDGDYFGTTLNRTARVMDAGHGGQILVAGSTSGLLPGVELRDLGEHRLRDIPETLQLFQVVADGIQSDFPPLRTATARLGNLEPPMVGLIGRNDQVERLRSLLEDHRLVTLTGFGGVGKTTLALHTADQLRSRFPDGVWLFELASVADPARIPEAVAATLGVGQAPGSTIVESVVSAVSGRRMLLLFDNCEHVLGAAADLVDEVLSHAWNVSVLATSREALGLAGEQRMVVPTLDVDAGAESAAVRLFLERARAVAPEQVLDTVEEVALVAETVRRLDGIALAIELAAARMVSMTVAELNDRLDDRFRLLSSRDRRAPHQQTLHEAVAWSYELLDAREQEMLDRCSVFADGFTVAAAARVGAEQPLDELDALDLLDSLVRKSLVTTTRTAGATRFEMLETIRQFGTANMIAAGVVDNVRDLHAAYFAESVEQYWDVACTPSQRQAIEWLDAEFANLRIAFRWTVDTGDLESASNLVAHTVMIGFAMQRYEPVGWIEEIVEAAIAADVPPLPRLLVAGGALSMTGEPERALELIDLATEQEARPDRRPFEPGWAGFWEGIAHRYAGRSDLYAENSDRLIGQGGLAEVIGLSCRLAVPTFSSVDELYDLGERAMKAADRRGIPYFIAFARGAFARALSSSDPERAMRLTNDTRDYAHEHGLAYFEAVLAREAAVLEVVHGDLHRALDLFDSALDSFHRDGNHASVATTFASLSTVFDRLDRPEVAATIYGAYSMLCESLGVALGDAGAHLRDVLGPERFDRCHDAGASMELGEAIRYAQGHVEAAHELVGPEGSSVVSPMA